MTIKELLVSTGGDEPPVRRLHLDKRADAIAASPVGEGDGEDQLTTLQVANWLGVSCQWLEIGRGKNYGPPFHRLGPQVIRYKRGEVRAWLDERKYASTSEYTSRRKRRNKKKSA